MHKILVFASFIYQIVTVAMSSSTKWQMLRTCIYNYQGIQKGCLY